MGLGSDMNFPNNLILVNFKSWMSELSLR